MKDVRFTLTPRHKPKLYIFFLRSREQESRDQTENSYKIMRNNTEPHFKHCTPIRFRELVILLETFDNSFTFLKYFNLNVKKYRNKKIIARKIRIGYLCSTIWEVKISLDLLAGKLLVF